MKKALFLLLLAVLSLLTVGSSLANAITPDSTDYLLIGEGGEGDSYHLQKNNLSAAKVFGGDLLKGCLLEQIDLIIVSGSAPHDSACYKAAKSVDSLAKIAFFPWALYEGAAVAESLGICFAAPVSTSEAFGYGYKPKNKDADFLIFVTMGQWNASDSEKKYFPIPKGLSEYAVCSTTADEQGNVLGACGPNVNFIEHWDLNYRSFVMMKIWSKHSLVRRRAQALGIKFTWQETRQLCYILAPEGSVDSLGRSESFRGMIDVSNPVKVDSALFEFQRQRQNSVAGVDCPIEVLPEQVTLHGNYPNPFNPFTTIAYTLARSGHIRVTIYNSLGQEIATLVDEDQTLGLHQVLWNAFNLPSGVYYYHLRGDGFYIVKPMTLLK